MTGNVIFLTHADVLVDPQVPVPDWGLNDAGRARHVRFAGDAALDGVTAIYASTERKAREGAAPIAARLGLDTQLRAALGENDRSATGFLPEDEFWPVVKSFFAEPDRAVRGWETANDAQSRIVTAVRAIVAEAPQGDIAIVAHGGVATLLRCHLAQIDITQTQGQPHPKGGCWYAFPRSMDAEPTEWNVI
jgi:broad specificity phosphatase PhoE